MHVYAIKCNDLLLNVGVWLYGTVYAIFSYFLRGSFQCSSMAYRVSCPPLIAALNVGCMIHVYIENPQ